MSTYWGLQCKQDGAKSGCGIRNYASMLEELAKVAPHVKRLQQADETHIVTLAVRDGWWYDNEEDVFAFLSIHGDHPLQLYNEYGHVEEL